MANAASVNEGSVSYQYEPLTSDSGEIRLVKITGLQEDAETDSIVLELDILHTPLDQPAPYLTISYTWGNPARTHKILVNGTALFVPENTFQTLYTVYHALPTLATEFCAPDEQFSLWIDAVCLNQSDVKEKDEQVRRMGQIYSHATGTIGYIGRPPKGKNPFDGFRTLLWMGNDMGFKTRDGVTMAAAYTWFGESNRDPDQFEQEVGPIAEFAEAYQNLFSSDWFLRCWVIQEMVLSQDVFCLYGHGSDFAIMNLDILSTLLRRSGSTQNYQHLSAIFYAMNGDIEITWARKEKEVHVEAWDNMRLQLERGQSAGLGLIKLLGRTRFAKFTDPRDRIYSLMGMMREQDRSAIRVDYSDDFTPTDLFLHIAVHCLGSPDCHLLLGWAGLRGSRIFSKLPSWAPDWSAQPAPFPVPRGLFSASGDLSHPLTLLDDGRRIATRGIPVGAINFLTLPMESSEDPARADTDQVLNFAAQLCHRLQREAIARGSHTADTYPFNHERWHDVMRRTCCMDRQSFPSKRAGTGSRLAFLACLDRYGFGAVALETVALDQMSGKVPVEEMATNHDDVRLEEAARGFEHPVVFVQGGRVLGIIGSQGLIGSFPKETRVGDIVAVFLGEELLVVLRPVEGAEMGFELVGMCYVHGIMDGEWITHMTGDQGQDSEAFQDFVIH